MKRRLQITHLMVCCWLLAAVGAFAQTPVANYSFTGSAKDQSSFANHASVNGATLTQDRFGLANSAFSFDGAQSAIRAENATQLNSPNATISFWVKPKAFPVQGEVYLLSFGGYQERYKISLPNHGKPVFTTHANGVCCSDMDSGTPLTIGAWTHVVMVHDGTNNIIYFNGVQVNQKAVAGPLDTTDKLLGIGYDPINNNASFDGAIDDVQLFDTGLTAAQVATLYAVQNTAPVVAQGVVAEYDFSGDGSENTDFANSADLSTGSLTTDRFGYGNSALLVDGTTSTVSASNASQLNSATTTISFWVKPNALPASGEVYLLSFGGYQERWKISMPNHGKPVFTTHAGGSCCSDLDSGTPLTVGTWTHVVMVHDGAKDIIYFNGVKVNEKASVGALDATDKPLGIGYDPFGNNGWFDGALDDISIYNYALTAAAITGLYATQSAFPGTATDLVASYPLNGNGADVTQFDNNAEVDVSAAATTNRFGWASNALQGYATADNSAALQSDYTTISFWVKPDAFPASGEVYLLSNGGYQERWKISMPNHGKPVFTTHAGGACCSDLDSGTPLTIGTWTHVVMVHDGAKDIIYFNGVQVNEKNAAGTLDKTKYPLGIGYDPLNNDGFFDGSLDDIQLYNRALTAAEIAALYAAQNATPVVLGNLIADYPAAGNANDATGYNNHATVQGAQLTTDRFGKANRAYSFNGIDQSLTAANSPQLNSASTTISFWVNPASFPASGEVYLLSNGGYQERWKVSMPNHGKPVFTTHANGMCCSDLDSGTPLTIGTWTHVVMVHDGSQDIIYFNGVQVNAKNTTGALDSTTKPLGIGFDPLNNNGYFDGSLDEIEIYNVALTAAQIAALYAAQNQAPVSTDTEAPCAPLNLAADVNFTNVSLTWLPAMDNVGVEAYNVYQEGALIATTPSLQSLVPNLTPLTEYVFGISAVDAEGNESLLTTLKVTSGEDESPDTTPPTAPGNLTGATGAYSVLLSWEASTDDRILGGYVVFVDGTYFDSLANDVTSVLVGGLDPETPYSFEIYAFDTAGNNSDTSEITLTTSGEINTGEAGLVAWYPFEGNANDATPYANHGVIGGNPVFEPAVGHANGGGQNIKFDGDQDSVLAPNAVQLISDYTTVSFWIRPNGINPAYAESYVLDFGHWSERWKISLPQHHKIVWTTNGNTVQFPEFISDMDSGDGNELVDGFWWYVTMVHDGTNDQVYVDGVLANSKPVPTKLNTTGLPLGMGNDPVGGGLYFNGGLDELKIYNKALTAEEIQQLYQFGTTSTKDDLSLALQQTVTMYPNPTADRLWVQHSFDLTKPMLLRIADVQGRQVGDLRFGKNEMPTGQFSVDVHNYATGTYFVNFVQDGKNIGSVKFTVK